jgi:phosphoribosylanthranilate isomerase
MSLWIKICGNTSIEDAVLAAEAGADALGFVFAPSPRRVTIQQVSAIVPHLPGHLEKIGVFVDATLDEIDAAVRACGLTGIQLHFDTSPDLPTQLRQRFGVNVRIVGVVRCPAQGSVGEPAAERMLKFASPFLDDQIDAILVDSYSLTTRGGTGQAFDWGLAAVTLFTDTRKRKIAAGGLTPENVAEAFRILNPWGVDVVSGVEASPGRKDPDKLRSFIANARTAASANPRLAL